MIKELKFFCIGILICIAVYIGVFIGRTSTRDTINLSNTDNSGESNRTAQINLNTATANELCALPGVGSNLAKAIIEYRERYGDYVMITELLYIEGMSKDLFDSIKPYLTVD